MNDEKISAMHSGVKVLHDPIRNKGTAFTEADRKALNLTGLLPPRVHSAAEQELRVLGNVRDKPTDLSRYLYLISLQDRNETYALCSSTDDRHVDLFPANRDTVLGSTDRYQQWIIRSQRKNEPR